MPRIQTSLALAFVVSFAGCGGTAGPAPGPPSLLPSTSSVFESNATALRFSLIQLPSQFSPNAMMKNDAIPGAFGETAAVYHSGTIRMLGKFGGFPTYATSVNTLGVAVGYSYGSTPPSQRALRFAGGKIADLGAPPSAAAANQAETINDVGDIYGSSWSFGLTNAAYQTQYRPGTPQIIKSSWDGRGFISNVNASGFYAYSGYFFASDFITAYRGKGLNVTALAPNYPWSTAAWINDAGTIVGSLSKATAAPFVPAHAYATTSANVMRVLPLLLGTNQMLPTGINKNGTIVGNAYTPSHAMRIFVYVSGSLHDATSALSPGGWPLRLIPGLADDGAFVGCNTRCYRVVPSGTVL